MMHEDQDETMKEASWDGRNLYESREELKELVNLFAIGLIPQDVAARRVKALRPEWYAEETS